MPLTRQRLGELLTEFRRETFKIDHNPDSLAKITEACKEIADEVMQEKFEYHFHKLPDANRVEIINMIHNYTTEALLPPIVAKITQRQIVLERKVDRVVELVEASLEALSEGVEATAAID